MEYHPDNDINQEVRSQILEAEIFDLSAGLPPRWWKCICGEIHNRGHFYSIGVHRCLKCGYVGDKGIMADNKYELE